MKLEQLIVQLSKEIDELEKLVQYCKNCASNNRKKIEDLEVELIGVKNKNIILELQLTRIKE